MSFIERESLNLFRESFIGGLTVLLSRTYVSMVTRLGGLQQSVKLLPLPVGTVVPYQFTRSGAILVATANQGERDKISPCH